MAGHSKWAQIKRQKGANDQKRGALFTKLTREIMQAARQGGPDPAANFKLRLAVQRARAANMPNDNIERAIARATGSASEDQLDEITYEGYGPGGIAILVSALTDNRNRTVSEVRHQFSRAGGSLGETGSVAWQFEPRGIITIPLEGRDPDEVALQAIDAGAEDVDVQGDVIEVRTDPAALESVRRQLEAAGYQVENADFAMIPKTTIELDEKTAHQALRLIEALEDLEDVQRVYSNADFSDEAIASYAG
ncbi:MAG: putative transcriptional regulatory protein [Tepidiforma sp.]|jgi:YebC/PmpR family DNA-binding regulatory protein|uniref:Probable transcriptional regulatory protein Tbon_01355 n=1 Tax=Tepidiforma bonchosmolovskayae TaxID=2601677 RepID=A0ABX6BYZ5_9CHLR|nr:MULTISPECIES: YebC/PmpR family DNA-binding transcriptional regulator [Tepidiforma]QFG02006.1 YebC/PmpR family DNA-binding transcriptional regulator [Tepidiforma bonchosmolovskayae]GIW15870.1 MAG: putative transcriptional regulatory protein [Tepidiforma sp.]